MSQDASTGALSRILKSVGVKELIAKTIITSIIAGITGIVYAAVRSFAQCNTGLLTIMLMSTGLILLAGSLFYVLFKKKEEEVVVNIDDMEWGKPRVKSVPRYSEVERRFALAGLLALLLLAIAGFLVLKTLDSRHPETVTILVANFDGPDTEYGMTEEVIRQLDDWQKNYAGDLIVRPLKQVIKVEGGPEEAQEKGNCFKASIVLWGSYRAYQGVARGTVYFQVLKWKGPQDVRINPKRLIDNAELKGFKIQTDLSSDISYLTLMTIGLARYEAQDYAGAIDRFNDALRQPSIPNDMISPAVVHFFKGLCHYETSQEASDPGKALNEAIHEFDETLNGLNVTTRDEDEEKMKWAADFNRRNADMLLAQYPNQQNARDVFQRTQRAYEDSARAYVNAGISEWAVRNNWGFALYQLGRRLEGQDARDRLEQARAQYDAAIALCTRDRQEQNCALTYFNLGNALFELAERTDGPEGDEYLERVETALRYALSKGYPISSAVTHNLANAQVVRGERTPGDQGTRFLRNAGETYETLIDVYEENSREYATVHYNLGYALLALSKRLGEEEKKDTLQKADAAFRVALDVSCRKQFFPLCAKVERDLAWTLYERAQLAAGQDKTTYLNEAKEDFELSKHFFDATNYPEENRKISDQLGAIVVELKTQ